MRKQICLGFENVLSQAVKYFYRYEKYTYSDLEKILIDDFKIGNDLQQEDLEGKVLEFKNEIYWVYKYPKLIQFIQLDPEGLISVRSICKSYLILDRKNSDNENFYILGFLRWL
ncbi:hypothetical protein [Methanosarcina horonobensis]|uniref:hypothetical protein n=1 Tax=Methanosarcina horonobensis TaxID=418008 RepID=UPI000AB15ADF|nr:hypothetical protein [Methanosarcina horonobensis]